MDGAFLEVNPAIRIPLWELSFTFVRSSGPGGQNVNKVNSKAVLRWGAVGSAAFQGGVRDYVLGRLAGDLTGDGELVITSDRFRDQGRNREDCLEKLRGLLLRAAHRPTPRKKTKPSRGARERKRESKTRHSQKKAMRRDY